MSECSRSVCESESSRSQVSEQSLRDREGEIESARIGEIRRRKRERERKGKRDTHTHTTHQGTYVCRVNNTYVCDSHGAFL